MLDDSGISRIKSNEFSEITQIPSATIRRGFSQLGELGRSGYGYDVPFLIDVFNNILNTKEEKPNRISWIRKSWQSIETQQF